MSFKQDKENRFYSPVTTTPQFQPRLYGQDAFYSGKSASFSHRARLPWAACAALASQLFATASEALSTPSAAMSSASSSRPPVCSCPHELLHHGRAAFVYRDRQGALALRILAEPQLHGVVQLLKQHCALQEHDPRGVHGAGAAAAER